LNAGRDARHWRERTAGRRRWPRCCRACWRRRRAASSIMAKSLCRIGPAEPDAHRAAGLSGSLFLVNPRKKNRRHYRLALGLMETTAGDRADAESPKCSTVSDYRAGSRSRFLSAAIVGGHSARPPFLRRRSPSQAPWCSSPGVICDERTSAIGRIACRRRSGNLMVDLQDQVGRANLHQATIWRRSSTSPIGCRYYRALVENGPVT